MSERISRTKLAAEAWGSVLRVHAALVPAMDVALQREAGMPLRWYDVLLELGAAPEGRLTLSDLADQVVLSRSRVSRVVDELVVAGHVAKVANTEDRRSAYAVITQQGRSAFEAAAPVYRSAIVELFAARLSDDQLSAVRDALGAVGRDA